MADTNTEPNRSKKRFDRAILHDWCVLFALIFLSILSVAITDAMNRLSHWYWLAMVPIFFSACVFLEWKSNLHEGIPVKQIVARQLMHWLSLLIAVFLTLM